MKLYRTTIVEEHPGGPHLVDPVKHGEIVAANSVDGAFRMARKIMDNADTMDVRYVCVQFLSDVEDVKGLNL